MPKVCLLFLCTFSLCLSIFSVFNSPQLTWAFEDPLVEIKPQAPSFQTVFDYTSTIGTAHSPAIDLKDDGFGLMWFDGLRESHNDVVIKSVDITLQDGTWHTSPPIDLLTRQTLSEATLPKQTILTLGNTIEYEGQDNTYLSTIVSIGGWAMASIAKVKVNANTVTRVEKLHLSPALNRSHLVRSPMVQFEGGDAGLPAYFELGNAFGELIRLSPSGRVQDKRRIGSGRLGIQPVIVVQSSQEAVALLRNFKKESDWLLASWTKDGGNSWTPLQALDVPNPNSPVAALLLSNGDILMAFNDSAKSALNLKLAVSSDGGLTWQRVATIEDSQDNAQSVRYPMMRRLSDGQIILTYSWGNKKGIRAHVFNEEWVRQ